MNYLSLFSGAGGGDLAAQHLKGWRCVGYVEFNEYCQRVIAARINDGLLDKAPIYGDVRTFISDGYAAAYTGLVDCITGGFPCQPFAHGSKMLGADDPRNMWPQTIDVIRLVRPKSVFLENVPGLISSGYIVTVCNELREAGYQVLPPLRLSASDLDYDHERERVWVAAHTPGKGRQGVLCGNIITVPKAHEGKKTNALDAILYRVSQIEKSLGKPGVLGTDDGLAHRVDRLAAIGNGQVPAVAAKAWSLLNK